MTTVLKRITKGIVLKPETSDVTENVEGSLWQNSTSLRIKSYIEAAVRQVVTDTQTQTLTNKTLTDPLIDVMRSTEQASTPANPAAGSQKIYFKTDGSLYRLNSAGSETLISGAPVTVFEEPTIKYGINYQQLTTTSFTTTKDDYMVGPFTIGASTTLTIGANTTLTIL